VLETLPRSATSMYFIPASPPVGRRSGPLSGRRYAVQWHR